MQRLMTVFAMLMLVVMTGCMMPAKTKVTKDGFTARQKTTEAHRAIVEDYDVYRTDCRYDQLAKDKDSEYYCPADATKEGYNSHVQLAQYMDSVLDKWGPKALEAAAFVGSAGLIRDGLRGAGARVTQSGTQTNIPVFESPGVVVKH